MHYDDRAIPLIVEGDREVAWGWTAARAAR